MTPSRGPWAPSASLTDCQWLLQVCSDSDYEIWSPPNNDSCLLGRKYNLQRRKQFADCFNDKRWTRDEATVTNCECQRVSTHVAVSCMQPAHGAAAVLFETGQVDCCAS